MQKNTRVKEALLKYVHGFASTRSLLCWIESFIMWYVIYAMSIIINMFEGGLVPVFNVQYLMFKCVYKDES